MVIRHLREDRRKEQRKEMEGEETRRARGDFLYREVKVKLGLNDKNSGGAPG